MPPPRCWNAASCAGSGAGENLSVDFSTHSKDQGIFIMLSPILACSDAAKAIDYYTQKLGFELAWQMPANESGRTEFACVKLGDSEILLGVTEGYVKSEDMDKRGIGIQIYINLPTTLDIEQVYSHAEANGAKIVREIETRDWGDRAFNVQDLDGYNLMIAQRVNKTE